MAKGPVFSAYIFYQNVKLLGKFIHLRVVDYPFKNKTDRKEIPNM